MLFTRFLESSELKLHCLTESYSEYSCQILAWARLDNQKALVAKLSLKGHVKVAEVILSAYLRWGTSCTEHLIGDYAFVVQDDRDQSIFAARDPMGVRPLYYYSNKDVLVFSTSLATLKTQENLDLTYSDQWLCLYMLRHSGYEELTPYQHIKMLPPGCILTAVDESNLSVRSYHEFNLKYDLASASEDEIIEGYADLFSDAVINRIQGAKRLGCELSGGLDSSSITAVTASKMHTGQSLHTISHIDSELEPAAIASITERISTEKQHVLYPSHLHPLESGQFEVVSEILGYPPTYLWFPSLLRQFELQKKEGLTTILSGIGGDEICTTSGLMAYADFWHQRRLIDLVQCQSGCLPVRSARAIRLASKFTRDRCRSIKALPDQTGLALFKDGLATHLGLNEVIHNPTETGFQYHSINDYLLSRLKSGQLNYRLELTSSLAAHFGQTVNFPMMDYRLVSFFLYAPPELKIGRGGKTRYLHRKAMKEILPSHILWHSKSMGAAITKTPRLWDFVVTGGIALELHPALQNLINADYYQTIIKQAHQPDAKSTMQHVDRRSLIMVMLLNRWLIHDQENSRSALH